MSGKTGTEAHRSAGFVGFINRYAAANLYDDQLPTDLCSGPLRHCGSGDLYGGNEPSRTWFAAMESRSPAASAKCSYRRPIHANRGAPGSRVPSVAGHGCRRRAWRALKDAGFQVADQTIGQQLRQVW